LGILLLSRFPEESGKSATFAFRRRLTGGLPDVGTDGVIHGSLIRALTEQPSRRKGGAWAAFKVP